MAESIALSDYRPSAIEPQVPEGCSAVFAPCLDPLCERPCGAHRPSPERAATIAALGWLRLLIGAATIITTLAAAGAYGLSQEERAYQISERV